MPRQTAAVHHSHTASAVHAKTVQLPENHHPARIVRCRTRPCLRNHTDQCFRIKIVAPVIRHLGDFQKRRRTEGSDSAYRGRRRGRTRRHLTGKLLRLTDIAIRIDICSTAVGNAGTAKEFAEGPGAGHCPELVAALFFTPPLVDGQRATQLRHGSQVRIEQIQVIPGASRRSESIDTKPEPREGRRH